MSALDRRTEMTTVAEYEAAQVKSANAMGKATVAFVQGLWLPPRCWDRWG